MAYKSSKGDGRVPPCNIQAEESLLGACLLSRPAQDDVLPYLAVGDLYRPSHQHIFEAMKNLARLAKPIDEVTVAEELRQNGLLDEVGGMEYILGLKNATPAISNATRYAEIILATSQQRALIVAATGIIDSAYGEGNVSETVMEAKTALDLVDLMGHTHINTVAGDRFVADEAAAYKWVVPYIVEQDDRMLVTGGEGTGKSLLLLQWAIMTACGSHWWTGTTVPHKRVCFVDLELGLKRTRRRAELFKSEADWSLEGWASNLTVWSNPEDIDISTRAGASWLASIVEQAEPDLLIIGPIYRLTSGVTKPGDIGGEDAAKRAAFALDKIRARFGCALVTETHAAKGDTGRSRDMRPFGSSVWTRWPEFGYAIVKQDTQAVGYHPDNRDWQHWRGDRDPRQWPDYFTLHTSGWRMRADFSVSGTPSWHAALMQGNLTTGVRRPRVAGQTTPLADPDDF